MKRETTNLREKAGHLIHGHIYSFCTGYKAGEKTTERKDVKILKHKSELGERKTNQLQRNR